MRALLVLVPLVLLAACTGAGSDGDADRAAAPEGYARHDGTDFSFAYPEDWTVSVQETEEGGRAESIAYVDGGEPVPSGVGFERGGTFPAGALDFADYAEQYDSLAEMNLPGREVLRFEVVQVAGADDARLIESRYQWPDGDVSVRQYDVVLLQEDRDQTPVLRISGPEETWDPALADAIVESFAFEADG